MAVDRIAYIKEKYSVLEYARDILGLPIRKSGDRCVSLAPGSHNPTAMIVFNDWWYDHKQALGGDVIDLCAAARHGGDKGAAIRELAGDYGIDNNWRQRTQERNDKIAYWHTQLRECDRHYMYRRGIAKETVNRLMIGYNAAEDRLIIPYFKNGYVAYYVGRDRSGNLEENSKYKKAYLDGVCENIPWGLHTLEDKNIKAAEERINKKYPDSSDFATEGMAIATGSVAKSSVPVAMKKIRKLADRQKLKNKYLVIAEGAFDAMSFEQEGFMVLSPISGYFNKDSKKQVMNIAQTKECVFVCFDSDSAGSRFTADMCKSLFKHRIKFDCGVLPEGIKDVSDYYAAGGDLFELVANAKPGIPMLAAQITDKDEFRQFVYDAARFVDEPDIVELCENAPKDFSTSWLKSVLKSALKMPPERRIIQEIMDNKTLKYIEGLGFYEYSNGVWLKRSDNFINGYLADLLGKWLTGTKLGSLLKALKAEITSEELFNRKPIFNFLNGVLELDTGKFREHNQFDMSTVQVGYNYDANADCPLWKKFIREVMANRPTSISLVQEMFGYILFNDCALQKCFFLMGDGANGKSVLLYIIGSVFSESNVSNVEMSSLTEPFQRISLIDSLVNISSETRTDVKGAESIFKQIVAGDTINGCYKNKDFVKFKPRCVLISACNDYVQSKDTTYGFLRRICFIDFPCKFEGDNADLNLKYKLQNEVAGIFNWSYEGYKRLKQQHHFTETDEQAEMMEEFSVIMNPVAAFISECLQDETERVPAEELYRRYVAWTKEAGHEALTRNKFILRFKKTVKQLIPSVTFKTIHGYRYFDFSREFLNFGT